MFRDLVYHIRPDACPFNIGDCGGVKRTSYCVMVLLLLVCTWRQVVCADELLLKEGTILEGDYIKLPSIIERPPRSGDEERPIPRPLFLVTDELRRIFVHRRQVADIRPTATFGNLEAFQVPQRIGRRVRFVKSVGPALRIGPFDEFGRRIYTMISDPGRQADVVQVITDIDPRVVKVSSTNYLWESRLATRSIPSGMLEKILNRVVDPQDSEHRLRLARFYIQGRYYRQARQTLQDVLRDFPEDAPKSDIEEALVSLHQSQSREVLTEIQQRRAVGQYVFAGELLKQFPRDDASTTILEELYTILEAQEQDVFQGKQVVRLLHKIFEKLDDHQLKGSALPVLEYMITTLRVETLPRMEPFLNFAEDEDLRSSEKLSLAITGWLMGADLAETDLSLAIRLWQARGLVLRYLRSDQSIQRQDILAKLRDIEGVSAERIAGIIHQLPPPLASDETVRSGIADSVKYDPDDPSLQYFISLPPEYRTGRHYPVILTLHGGASTCQMQMDWWKIQAARRGYIVIAPEFFEPEKKQYGFSGKEHNRVLDALCDAKKRFQIDSDRIFLTGHSTGAVAAWDIGLSHPHLFAGVIPIVGYPEKYSRFYRENAGLLPFYVVGGQRDGDIPGIVGKELDRWMRAGYDVRYVEYIGRGHEHFREEIHHIFDWMQHRTRAVDPREFVCRTLRPNDNRFYWLELGNFPELVALPAELFGRKKPRPMKLKGMVKRTGSINVQGAGGTEINILLSPDLVEFGKRIRVSVNGRSRFHDYLEPDLEDMLEDVRIRGDRSHFCWLKLSL